MDILNCYSFEEFSLKGKDEKNKKAIIKKHDGEIVLVKDTEQIPFYLVGKLNFKKGDFDCYVLDRGNRQMVMHYHDLEALLIPMGQIRL